MNLNEAIKLANADHVEAAAAWVDSHCLSGDFGSLYNRTGRTPPRHRFVSYKGKQYPAKAFGFLVAQIAGSTDRKENDLTVNEVTGPLKKFSVTGAV